MLVPLASISVALLVSTSAVAALTQLGNVPGFGWWELKVFTTTKIFVVVILFGAGTDYCLFLISRYREELSRGHRGSAAIRRSLAQVGHALSASALTTIVGLGMMFFASFGKFRFSGPVIGLCLMVTLLTCVTFTPALLRLLGPLVFWPRGADRSMNNRRVSARFWSATARQVVARPGLVLTVSTVCLLPLAGYGWWTGGEVTYDLLSALAPERPSKQAWNPFGLALA